MTSCQKAFLLSLVAGIAACETPAPVVPPPPVEVAAPPPPNPVSVAVPPECVDATKIPFTYELAVETHLSAEQLKQLQFYSARTFTLTRRLTAEEAGVSKHKVLTKSDGVFEEIEVGCLTPGLVVDVGTTMRANDRFSVSFEKGSPGLQFTNTTAAVLAAPEYASLGSAYLGDEYWLSCDGRVRPTRMGPATYDPHGNSYLLVERDKIESFKKIHKVLPGNTFEDAPPK
jgi:hypothetical protein